MYLFADSGLHYIYGSNRQLLHSKEEGGSGDGRDGDPRVTLGDIDAYFLKFPGGKEFDEGGQVDEGNATHRGACVASLHAEGVSHG